MKSILFILSGLLAVTLRVIAQDTDGAQDEAKQIFCYYDTKLADKVGIFDIRKNKLKKFLPEKKKGVAVPGPLMNCTHLVIGYGTVNNETYELEVPELESLKEDIADLKNAYEHLLVLLAVGGDDEYDNQKTYLNTLVNEENRNTFVNSVEQVLKAYNFDKLELSWPFPKTVVQNQNQNRNRGGFEFNANVQGGVGVRFGGRNRGRAKQSLTPRNGFTELLRALNKNNLVSIVTVLPNIEASEYFDVDNIMDLVQYVNVAVYDIYTPLRTPKLAGSISPLYGHRNQRSADSLIQSWIKMGAPREKIVMGVTFHGDGWSKDVTKMIKSGKMIHNRDVAPTFTADSISRRIAHYKIPGYFTFDVVNSLVKNNKNFKRVYDSNIGEVHAYKVLPLNKDNTTATASQEVARYELIWISYEDPATLGQKAGYVVDNNLAGISISTLEDDDSIPLSSKIKYPLLSAVNKNLS